MDRSGAQSRASSRKRQPLGDGASRANTVALSPHQTKADSSISPDSSGALPHHESVPANGALTVKNATKSTASRRASPVIEEEDEKRNSQVSTASTNASTRGLKRKTHIGPWQLGASIGGGSVGTVRKVRHMVTGQMAAAKVIAKNTADLSRAESMAHFAKTYKNNKGEGVTLPFGIEREVVIMKLLEHPNIVQLYDVWENRSQLYLIMEYVEGGELFDYVKGGPLEEDEAVWIFRQICAALLHAHQFRIYHRDLKPENILLSHQYDLETGRDNPQIKLVDFGMAALQPRGKNLISPCGSVHYAAPEIFKKNYDGAKADVWSLGIIIYIMLVGTIPFAWSSIQPENYFLEWYNHITRGNIDIPAQLSPEARDLIRRMLIVNPEQRISLQQVWSHPLLKKWSVAWQESPEERTLEAWVGIAQPIGDLSLRSKSDIDREILRNLRILWHSETEDTLVKRLLNSDKNLEKYFYHALTRHREDQQENFIGLPEELAYSSSDYHYLKPVLHPSEVPPIPQSAFVRTKSNFSILNDDEIKASRSNSTRPTPSERSYDPFRSSRTAWTGDRAANYSVTVHRGVSANSNKTNAAQSAKGTGSLRVEALKKQQRLSGCSSGHLVVKKSSSPRPCSRRSMSRSSMGSSLCHTSPPSSIVMRPGDKHRRGVDFSQVKKSSTTNNLTIESLKSASTMDTPKKPRRTIVAPDDSIIESVETDDSPSPQEGSEKTVGSRRGGKLADAHSMRIRRAATHSQVIETEARKVSTELETLCEVAFNRDSAASSSEVSGGNVGSSYETPPSSISNRGSTHSTQALAGILSSVDPKSPATRSMSDGAYDTPNTYITRELQEARKKIANRYRQDEFAQSNPNYREVLSQIDAFLESNGAAHGASKHRARPASSERKPAEHLPSISEKNSTEEPPLRRQAQMRMANFSRHAPSSSQQSDVQKTVRLVDETSPKRPAPLNVRKTSTVSSRGSSAAPSTPTPVPTNPKASRFYSGSVESSTPSFKPPVAKPAHRQIPLDAIVEEAAARDAITRLDASVPKKKRNWFRKIWDDGTQPAGRGPVQMWDERRTMLAGETTKLRKRDSNTSSTTSSGKVAVPGKRPGFLSLLGKRKAPKRTERAGLGRDDSSMESLRGEVDNMSTVTSYTRKAATEQGATGTSRRTTNMAYVEHQKHDARDLGVQRNWLARFFHIKPASTVMCFDVSRGRARQELVRILRSWRMYGVRDVVLDREKNLVFGRLAADNYLRYKPMDFVIELFVVLEYGHRANLSLARFTQRKGAASTFNKLVATLEDVLQRKGLVVEERQRRQEMEAILRG